MSKKILLICRTAERGPTKYENLKFKLAAKNLGYHLDIIPFPELKLKQALKYDIVLPRTGSGQGSSVELFKFISKLEERGLRVINKSKASKLAQNKYDCLKFLEKASDMNIPKTVTVKEYKKLKFPFVAKPQLGAKGQSVMLIEDEEQLKKIGNKDFLLQEFISESRGKDIRVIVTKQKTIGAIMRKSQAQDFRANVSLGGKTTPYPISPELKNASLSICQNLGLDYCGCDFLIGKTKLYLCEVNIHPDFQGFEKAHNLEVAEEIFKIF